MKKLTVIDQQEHPIYKKEDFARCFKPEEIVILCVPESKTFDGSILSRVPADTTHLLMRVLDRIDESNLKNLPSLTYVGITSTGWYDQYFDRRALEAREVVVTNNPTYAKEAVAEAIFATLLAQQRKLFELPLGKVTVEVPIGRELSGQTMGILGLGRIGLRVAKIALGFNMRVVSTSEKKRNGVENVDREKLFRESDVISLHVPKSAGVMISQEDFKDLKPAVVIVNSAGFNLIDLESLIEFLQQHDRAAYIDLSYPEGESFAKLSRCQNAYLYPLFSNQTEEAFINKKRVPIENLCNFVKATGEINRVI